MVKRWNRNRVQKMQIFPPVSRPHHTLRALPKAHSRWIELTWSEKHFTDQHRNEVHRAHSPIAQLHIRIAQRALEFDFHLREVVKFRIPVYYIKEMCKILCARESHFPFFTPQQIQAVAATSCELNWNLARSLSQFMYIELRLWAP